MIEYLITLTTVIELTAILVLLSLSALQLLRREKARETGLAESVSDKIALITTVARNPVVIKRSIVVANGRAALALPSEKALELL